MDIDLLSLPYEDMVTLVTDMGYPAFRAKQLRGWVAKGTPIEDMSNLPRDFRAKLIETGCHVTLPRIARKLISQIDGTVKYLFALSDGQLIESVVMKYKHGNTICVSCQAGCRMGCRFCASTLRGLTRHLTPSEILTVRCSSPLVICPCSAAARWKRCAASTRKTVPTAP